MSDPQTQNPVNQLQNPPQGLFGANPSPTAPFQFSTFLQTAIDRLNSLDPMIKQKNLLIRHLYDMPLKPEEIQSLPQPIQQSLATGDRHEVELQLGLLNDQIAGRTQTMNQSVDFLTRGYEASVMAAQNQYQNSVSEVEKFATLYGSNASNVMHQLFGPQKVQKLKEMGIDIDALSAPTIAAQRLQIQLGGGAGGTSDADVLTGMLSAYSKGQNVQFGFGSAGLRRQFYAAIGAAERGGTDIVSEALSNKAAIAGATSALRTQQMQYSANQTSIKTLDKQLALVKKYSNKVSRSDSPFINRYLLWIKGQGLGDADTAALNNIVKTASYEFAKILSGAAASIAGVTVTSAADAEAMLNSALSQGQFNEVLGLMEQEANFRLQSQKDTINQIQSDIKSGFKVDSSQPQGATVLMTGPDGTQWNVPNDKVDLFKQNGYK